ncbi:MAG: hypothetical protein EZS28_004161 [Streblomastix strix]|uniref:B30.2/SPRY domain-containing protein n=1 Tax=Streblomastix strix TaxID=222440 RepID=A0A5J4X120_9EUKA|nr:MAG: hypothetical protein EZS28_004161 [Streblomastix strix]
MTDSVDQDSLAQKGIQSEDQEIQAYITVPDGSYTKDGELTFTLTAQEYKTFPVSPVVTQGIYKCELKVNKLGNFNFGVMKSGLVIPFGMNGNQYPYFKDCMFFHSNGSLYQNHKTPAGNQQIKEGDVAAIEVNLAEPKTAHLFINDVQQPVYMSGIPDKVQFFFNINFPGESVTVLSLRKLNVPNAKNISGEIEIKWQ